MQAYTTYFRHIQLWVYTAIYKAGIKDVFFFFQILFLFVFDLRMQGQLNSLHQWHKQLCTDVFDCMLFIKSKTLMFAQIVITRLLDFLFQTITF